jgi:hypothetical protein
MTIQEKTIVNGGGSQTGIWNGRSRWGDYSAISIDPAAPTTFWFTTEYYITTSTSSWQTRIASFTFANVFSSAASGTPGIICSTNADSSQLHAYGYGGSGNYTYSWTSIPSGFTSAMQNPKVRPLHTTKYIAATSDGAQTRHDTTEVRIVDAPTAFAGNDTIVCWYASPIPVNATATGYLRFLWGSTGDGTFTDPNSLTTAYIPGIHDKTSGGTDLKLIVWPLSPCMNKATDILHITLDPCTGISDKTLGGLSLIILPNPAHDKVSISIAGLQQKAMLIITAMDGRVVHSVSLDQAVDRSITEHLDLTSWPKGMYLVKVQSDARIAVARFIVQ